MASALRGLSPALDHGPLPRARHFDFEPMSSPAASYFAVLSAFAVACAPAAPPHSAATLAQQASLDPLVGCYRLELGAWDPPLYPGSAEYVTPPEEIRLSREVGEGVFEQGKTIVRPVIPHGRTPSAFWERIAEDSVRVVWTDGHGGVRLDLQVTADSLYGIARLFADVIGGPPAPQAKVVLRPAPCGDEEPLTNGLDAGSAV